MPNGALIPGMLERWSHPLTIYTWPLRWTTYHTTCRTFPDPKLRAPRNKECNTVFLGCYSRSIPWQNQSRSTLTRLPLRPDCTADFPAMENESKNRLRKIPRPKQWSTLNNACTINQSINQSINTLISRCAICIEWRCATAEQMSRIMDAASTSRKRHKTRKKKKFHEKSCQRKRRQKKWPDQSREHWRRHCSTEC